MNYIPRRVEENTSFFVEDAVLVPTHVQPSVPYLPPMPVSMPQIEDVSLGAEHLGMVIDNVVLTKDEAQVYRRIQEYVKQNKHLNHVLRDNNTRLQVSLMCYETTILDYR